MREMEQGKSGKRCRQTGAAVGTGYDFIGAWWETEMERGCSGHVARSRSMIRTIAPRDPNARRPACLQPARVVAGEEGGAALVRSLHFAGRPPRPRFDFLVHCSPVLLPVVLGARAPLHRRSAPSMDAALRRRER